MSISRLHYYNLVLQNTVLCCTQSFSCVRLFATPWTAASRLFCPWGFSRQEYRSRLTCPPPGDLPSPGIEPRSPTLQAGSLQSESQGKPKNTGMDSLSLLQGIFPTQESNQGFLHCKWIFLPAELPGQPLQNATIGENQAKCTRDHTVLFLRPPCVNAILQRNENLLNKCHWDNWISIWKKVNLDAFLILSMKN